MKRTLSSSVLKKQGKRETDETPVDERASLAQASEGATAGMKPRLGGAGSAWKAGALSDVSQVMQAERSRLVERILNGRQELTLQPDQIVDVVGTDRRADWRDQEAFEKLKASIEKNGQDTPVQVWPADPDWRPDERAPENVDGVEFHLLVGRRRHAILQELGRPVRAILVPQEQRGSAEEAFERLFMRFRENEERENLSAFERLLSIGEMFERLLDAAPDRKLTATEFASRVGVHNSAVSRGRAVYAARKDILHACKDPYSLSHRQLEDLLAQLVEKVSKAPKKRAAKPQKLVVHKQVGASKLALTGQGGRLTIAASGLALDKDILDGLGDLVATYLEKHRPKERS